MNVSNLACLAVLALALGSCKKEQSENGGTGSLVTHIVFERSATRASSSAVPQTSWSSIKQVQMFLYDATSGVIKFSDIFIPSPASGTSLKQTWPMVPEGEYQLVLVANAKYRSDSILTTIVAGNTPATTWTAMNVRNVASANLGIYHLPRSGGFPPPIATGLGAGHALKAFSPPSEVFMAYSSSNVKIESGKMTDISTSDPLTLKREVALMRVRVRVNDKSQGYDNTDVDFAHNDASILIYTLPDKIGIRAKDDGGVVTTSDDKSVMVGASGTATFFTADPTTGYNPTKIVDTNFGLWRDIVVFPNNGGRKTPSATASAAQRYYVVVTGHASENHVLGNQSKVGSGGALVHWGGLVEASFEPNTIRELNLTLTSGGTTGVPSVPAKEGGLTIQVSAPAPWDSNIKVTDLNI